MELQQFTRGGVETPSVAAGGLPTSSLCSVCSLQRIHHPPENRRELFLRSVRVDAEGWDGSGTSQLMELTVGHMRTSHDSQCGLSEGSLTTQELF